MSTSTATRCVVKAKMIYLRVPGGYLPTRAGHAATWVTVPYYEGAWTPEEANPDDLARHLAEGMIEPIT